MVASDTGPGNMVIDGVVELLDHPYFRQRPPKSTGREVFGRAYTV